MGKKKKAKAKVKETPEEVPEATCKVDVGDETKKAIDQAPPKEEIEDVLPKTENKGISKEEGFYRPDVKNLMDTPTKEEIKPEKDPEPVNKPEEPETAPVEAPAEEQIVEEVPEGMVKIPCECIKCKNKFDLFVPKGLGTPILYYRDCEKCR